MIGKSSSSNTPYSPAGPGSSNRGSATNLLYQQFSDILSRANGGISVNSLPGVDCSLGTTVGLQRSENEDRLLVARSGFLNPPSEPFLLFALSDGMGGMRDGAQCARRSLCTLLTSLIDSKQQNLEQRLVQAVQDANWAVYKEYQGRGGATLSVLLIARNGFAALANVGDSRIYQLERSKSPVLRQLTDDDTIEAQVAKFRRNKVAQDADPDPSRRQLVQYVGMGKGMEPHCQRLGPDRLADGFLITSDGVHGISARSLSEIAIHAMSSEQLAQRLLSVSEWCGGHDNASVICVFPQTIRRFLELRPKRSSFATIWTPNQNSEVYVELSMLQAVKPPELSSQNARFALRNPPRTTKKKQTANKKRKFKLKRTIKPLNRPPVVDQDQEQMDIRFVPNEGDDEDANDT